MARTQSTEAPMQVTGTKRRPVAALAAAIAALIIAAVLAPSALAADVIDREQTDTVGNNENWHMTTKAKFIRSASRIDATTRTWDTDTWWGFTGGVSVTYT